MQAVTWGAQLSNLLAYGDGVIVVGVAALHSIALSLQVKDILGISGV